MSSPFEQLTAANDQAMRQNAIWQSEKLRRLTQLGFSYLERGLPYGQACSAMWFLNDELQCDPDEVREACRWMIITFMEGARTYYLRGGECRR